MYERIRNMREDRDLKQKDVSNYLNCSQTCYSRYELGERAIPSEVLVKLAILYETSVDYLLELTNEKKPYQRRHNTKGV